MYLNIHLFTPMRSFIACCCLLLASHVQASDTEQFFAYFNSEQFAKAAALYTYPFHMPKQKHDRALRTATADLKELFELTGVITLGNSVSSGKITGLNGLAVVLAEIGYVKSNTASQKFFAAKSEKRGDLIVNTKHEMFRQEPLAVYVYFLTSP